MKWEEAYKILDNYFNGTEKSFIAKRRQALRVIKENLDMLEELKNPYDEYETEDYLLTRQAYYNENLGELCYAYTIYEWRGEYIERDIPILKKKKKFKKWEEVFHAGTGSEKKELNEQFIKDHLKMVEIISEGN